MRYMGGEYTAEGVKIAIIDSGINPDDPRLAGVTVEGWSIQLGATGHALLSPDFHDQNGHGTEIAAAVHQMAPDATLVAVKIMGERLRTSAELMAAGIETAARSGSARGEPVARHAEHGQGPAAPRLLRERGRVRVHRPRGGPPEGRARLPRGSPRDLRRGGPPRLSPRQVLLLQPQAVPAQGVGVLSDKFLTHGYGITRDGRTGRYRGSGMATAYLSGQAACMAQALPGIPGADLIKRLKRQALIPIPEIGYG